MNENGRDWHKADIKAALEKAGTNYSKLAEENKVKSSTLRNALRTPYPKMECIIAKKLGLTPKDIWPSRYQERTI